MVVSRPVGPVVGLRGEDSGIEVVVEAPVAPTWCVSRPIPLYVSAVPMSDLSRIPDDETLPGPERLSVLLTRSNNQ